MGVSPWRVIGHDMTEDSWDLNNAIVIIVSHSGGTFGPLAGAHTPPLLILPLSRF